MNILVALYVYTYIDCNCTHIYIAGGMLSFCK